MHLGMPECHKPFLGHCDLDLWPSFQELLCPEHIFYIIWCRNPNFGVVIPLGMAEWCIPFWALWPWHWLLASFLGFWCYITAIFPQMCLMLDQFLRGIRHVFVTFLVWKLFPDVCIILATNLGKLFNFLKAISWCLYNFSLYSKCYKVSNTFLFLFSNKMLVIRIGINKILVRIANRKEPDQASSSEADWSGLHCLLMLLRHAASVRNLRTSAVISIQLSLLFHYI